MTSFPRLKNATASIQGGLVQEGAGFHLGIGSDLDETGAKAAITIKSRYDAWRYIGRHQGDSAYKQQHFTMAVGGGNTVKAVYRALLETHAYDINWIHNVRFYFLDESTGERNWTSATDTLISAFLSPLASKLVRRHGPRKLCKQLGIDKSVPEGDIAEHMLRQMIHPIHMAEVKSALRAGNTKLAQELARTESQRYQTLVRKHLGGPLSFHMIVTGISREGGLGAFRPYTAALADKKARVVVVPHDNGSLRVALGRGILIRAECVALIISGSLKLKALGRFEMAESADFEQTVMETPVRMLRERYDIAERVYVFADDQALHFKEAVFNYRQDGNIISTKAEVREGSENDGIHIFLLHGFMGLYSYVNFLIRLPSAWTVSALHRGKHAKKLPAKEIFPHYATALRKAILKNWRAGRPTPVGYHSIAGVISDHLLLSIVEGYEELPAFRDLRKEDQHLVEALRCGGLIHMATWAPSDIVHIAENTSIMRTHLRKKTPLDYGGPEQTYIEDDQGKLSLADEAGILNSQPGRLITFTRLPTVEHFINALNRFLRYLMDNRDLQQKLSQREIPYGLRLMGGRLLRKVSFYGLLKEISASLHDPLEYQQLHLRALDIIVKYDIPSLTIIHRDDFMVSANRHREEHDYLVQQRLLKEKVSREKDLKVPIRLLLLDRETEELPVDPLNPHLMLMSTSQEGDRLSRQVTSAITSFVNENVAASQKRRRVTVLASVKKWHAGRKKPLRKQAPAAKKAQG
jgi:6-phosphogluconolactonase/glucosamine-6-phosphate isomerase/deaminase